MEEKTFMGVITAQKPEVQSQEGKENKIEELIEIMADEAIEQEWVEDRFIDLCTFVGWMSEAANLCGEEGVYDAWGEYDKEAALEYYCRYLVEKGEIVDWDWDYGHQKVYLKRRFVIYKSKQGEYDVSPVGKSFFRTDWYPIDEMDEDDTFYTLEANTSDDGFEILSSFDGLTLDNAEEIAKEYLKDWCDSQEVEEDEYDEYCATLYKWHIKYNDYGEWYVEIAEELAEYTL